MQSYDIPFHEKHKGQLFCDRSAEDLIQMLLKECDEGGVQRWHGCGVKSVSQSDSGYQLQTDQGEVQASAVVIATGGLSIPQIGATDFGYRIAEQFGLAVGGQTAGLPVPFTFDGNEWAPYVSLAGLSLPVSIETGAKKTRMSFDEDLLFTHRGLSGPAVLQISSYWREGQPLHLNLAPREDIEGSLMQAKGRVQKLIANELGAWVPHRLADAWAGPRPPVAAPCGRGQRQGLWPSWPQHSATGPSRPTAAEGYKKAEVTLGGVDARDLSSANRGRSQAAWPVFHWRSGGHHGLARRLQLPVGLRPAHLPAPKPWSGNTKLPPKWPL
jgi:predicted Rossmann fold flavoprotein